MTNRYVNVKITRNTKAVTQAGFGLPLILSTDKDAEYKEYIDLDGIVEDFGEGSNTHKLSVALLKQNPRPEKVAVFGVIYDNENGEPDALTTALNELVKSHNDFFYLTSTEQGDAEITALSAWTSATEKLYFASTSNEELAEQLLSENTIILVHDQPETYPAEAWIGVCAPQEIGSYTWTFKTLNGIKPAAYDKTTVDAIEDANASTYINEGGVNITSKGITTSGEYIDIIQGQYFIKSRMTESVFSLLARSPKVPFVDSGIALVVAEVEKTLKQAASQGVIATDDDGNPLYTVTAPSRAEVPENDRAKRTLPGVKWSATIAGAVENVEIGGTLEI